MQLATVTMQMGDIAAEKALFTETEAEMTSLLREQHLSTLECKMQLATGTMQMG